MRTNQKPLVLGILFFLTIALAVALLTHENDPKYNGVSIAFLLNQAIDRQVFDANLAFRTRHTGWVPDPVAEEAFRRVGTNALPYLLKTIRYDPHPAQIELFRWLTAQRQTRLGWVVPRSFTMDVIYRHFQQADRAVRGFELLADVAKPAITSLGKLARSAQSPETVVRAVRALQGIGIDSLPALGRLVTGPNPKTEAIAPILQIGSKGAVVAPYIQQILTGDPVYAEISVWGLRCLPPSNAVPILIAILQNPDPKLRAGSAGVLGTFSRQAVRSAIPSLVECLRDSSPSVQQEALKTLWYLAPDLFTNVPCPARTQSRRSSCAARQKLRRTLFALSSSGGEGRGRRLYGSIGLFRQPLRCAMSIPASMDWFRSNHRAPINLASKGERDFSCVERGCDFIV